MEKRYLLKLFKEWEEEGMKGNSGEDAFKYNIYLIYCKSFHKSHNVLSPSSTTTKNG
jgi:hypothetical protein